MVYQEAKPYNPIVSPPKFSTGIDVVDSIFGSTLNPVVRRDFTKMSPGEQEDERQGMILTIARIVKQYPELGLGLSGERLQHIDLHNLESIKLRYEYHEAIQVNIFYFTTMKYAAFLFLELVLRNIFDIDLPGFADRESANPAYDNIIGSLAEKYTTKPGLPGTVAQQDPMKALLYAVAFNTLIAVFAAKVGAHPDEVRKNLNKSTGLFSGGLGGLLGGMFGGGNR